jgi:GST-like protein
VIRWAEAIDARRPVKRGRVVNAARGEVQLRERHSAADLDALGL